ncbi:CPBP family intramembrane glutamic endopeptidase [Haloactinopolyspora alba]|uniref:CPBP family intramembrane glutamic endopeptidase n=1 Tax=Haloactinopolyspora alba TaxID=648780 RepID=UPI000D0D8247|nr:CPBP family intramembrane glutamic endopeptidase [Haloactinopolyspora alba]
MSQAADEASTGRSRRRLTAEIWIVLGLSLGQSAVYAVVSLVAKLTEDEELRDQTATLNASQSTREYLDLTYQVLSIAFAFVPVVLALFLLSAPGRSAVRAIGFDLGRPWRDLAAGAGLATVVGLPGIGVYLLGRELNLTATVVPSALNEYWWTVPILVLSALQNAVVEEVVAVGFLMTRLRQLNWQLPMIIATSAVLRGSYHLYQGFGMAIGNAVMGVLFGWWFHRTGRVMPLVVAHTVLDIVSFVGYALFKDVLGLP